MRIAVCLSGQPRVIEYTAAYIKKFFSGEHEYDFFCQSWDYNSYKRKAIDPKPGEQPVWWDDDRPVDHEWLKNQLTSFQPKKYVIQSLQPNRPCNRFQWDSMFYAAMTANNLKKQYEVENNFRYDFVIKTRYDIIFRDQQFKFDPSARPDNYLDIFVTHQSRMDYEYNRVNVSDAIFYGSSTAMDLISDVHRELSRKDQLKRDDDHVCIGPGTAMSDLAEERNMRLIVSFENLETVYRLEVIPLDPVLDFQEILDFNNSFYRIIT